MTRAALGPESRGAGEEAMVRQRRLWGIRRTCTRLGSRAAAGLAVLVVAAATLAPAPAMAQPAAGTLALGSGTLVSFRKPDGLILSTGNLYFTSHDGATASVWRTAQGASSGQEMLLYSEPGARFGDIVFAQVDGVWWGYFWAQTAVGGAIKRVPLTGGTATTLTTATNIDVVNSHRNLLADGVNLYWQDVDSVRKMPIRGGAVTVLDPASPNTPTAGLALQNGNIIYASVAAIRWVPPSGSIVGPFFRTIATASSRVTALHATSDGIVWGENSGAVRQKVGSTTTTLSTGGLVPTAISANGSRAFAKRAWTQCGSQTCLLTVRTLFATSSMSIGADALGATVTPAGQVFWGDAAGVHRL
jgi:hypothetical protein